MFKEKIQQMLDTIKRHDEYSILPHKISEKVINAIKEVPRHKFVPEEEEYLAYEDTPLPIGYGQTISQPYIVALMTEMLQLKPQAKVLEIGTGSGYQAAVLSKLAKNVYTIEVVHDLANKAKEKFQQLGYDNIKSICKDGHEGWEEFSPYDGIIVTAAAKNEIPESLKQQLTIGGRMIIPLEDKYGYQRLYLIEKSGDNDFDITETIDVRFVPLVEK